LQKIFKEYFLSNAISIKY